MIHRTSKQSHIDNAPRVIGADEVGWGPMAGPLVVVACCAPADWAPDPRVMDSKAVKKAKDRRQVAEAYIADPRFKYGFGIVSVDDFDRQGAGSSLIQAFREAVLCCANALWYESVQLLLQEPKHSFCLGCGGNNGYHPTHCSVCFEYPPVVIDGNLDPNKFKGLESFSVSTVTRGDSRVPEVSLASCVAKHFRDQYMTRLAREYPGYGFESHFGYVTKKHKAKLVELGVTPHHRRRFKPVRDVLVGSALNQATVAWEGARG